MPHALPLSPVLKHGLRSLMCRRGKDHEIHATTPARMNLTVIQVSV